MTVQTSSEELTPVDAEFLPLHKLATGVAIGTAAALLVTALTIDAIVRPPESRLPMELLSAYFAGYTVSWPGVLIGAWWAWFAGFVAGWFLAFVRNFTLACEIVWVRTRANLVQTRDFLDHI